MFLCNSFKYYCMRTSWCSISTHLTQNNKKPSCILFKIWSCYFAKIDKNVAWENTVSFINYGIRNHSNTLQLKTTIILFCVSSAGWFFYSYLAFLKQFHKMVVVAAVAGAGCLRQGAPPWYCSSLGISAFRTYPHDHFFQQVVLGFYHGNSRLLKGSRRCQNL